MNPTMSTLKKFYLIPCILSLVTTFAGLTAFMEEHDEVMEHHFSDVFEGSLVVLMTALVQRHRQGNEQDMLDLV